LHPHAKAPLCGHTITFLVPTKHFIMRLVSALVILLVCAPYDTYAWSLNPFGGGDDEKDKDKKALRGSPEDEIKEAEKEIAISEAEGAQAMALLDGIAAEVAEEDEEEEEDEDDEDDEEDEKEGNAYAYGHAKKEGDVVMAEEKKDGGNAYGQEKKDGNPGTAEEKKDGGNAYGQAKKDGDLGTAEEKKDGGNSYAYGKEKEGNASTNGQKIGYGKNGGK